VSGLTPEPTRWGLVRLVDAQGRVVRLVPRDSLHLDDLREALRAWAERMASEVTS
jgi:hypothetical protein